MLSLPSILSLAAALSGAAHIYCEYRPPAVGRYLFKPLTLVLLMALVVSMQGVGLLFLALCFCWLGDVALMMPSRSDRWFLAGLVAFLLGHVVFVVIMLSGLAAVPAVVWLALAAVGAIAFKLIVLPAKKLAPAVLLYVSVITVMVAAAIGQVVSGAATLLLGLGVVLFAVSDFLLGYNRFNQPLKLAQLKVLGTYYAAQIMIVLSHVKD